MSTLQQIGAYLGAKFKALDSRVTVVENNSSGGSGSGSSGTTYTEDVAICIPLNDSYNSFTLYIPKKSYTLQGIIFEGFTYNVVSSYQDFGRTLNKNYTQLTENEQYYIFSPKFFAVNQWVERLEEEGSVFIAFIVDTDGHLCAHYRIKLQSSLS